MLAAWIIPLTFLPGVAVLVLSTSNRFFHVNSLIRTAAKESNSDAEHIQKLAKRSRLFHSALTLMYVSVALFSVSALMGNIQQNWFEGSTLCLYISDGLVLAGVACVVLAAACLIRESVVSAQMIRQIVQKHG